MRVVCWDFTSRSCESCLVSFTPHHNMPATKAWVWPTTDGHDQSTDKTHEESKDVQNQGSSCLLQELSWSFHLVPPATSQLEILSDCQTFLTHRSYMNGTASRNTVRKKLERKMNIVKPVPPAKTVSWQCYAVEWVTHTLQTTSLGIQL